MKAFYELLEGVYDPNIFKAFFMAGGPGSGKSYVAGKTTAGQGLKVVNSDDIFEKLLDKEGLSKKMPESEKEPRDIVRQRAKRLTAKKKENFIEGRLGLIIDGTGKDYDKIARQATKLKQLGYDVHMIFVNTSLDVALQRNADRARKLAEPLVVKSWKDVQKNIGKFNNYFKGNFIIIDNNDAKEDVFTEVFKRVRSLANRKIQNKRAQQWIDNELKMRNITKFKRKVV